MSDVKELFVGEQPLLEFQVANDDDGAPIDLSGLAPSSINIYLRLEGANTNIDFFPTTATAITDAVNGKFTYQIPRALARSDVGTAKGQVVITFTASHVRITKYFDVKILPSIKP